jgi:hypothetical protein
VLVGVAYLVTPLYGKERMGDTRPVIAELGPLLAGCSGSRPCSPVGAISGVLEGFPPTGEAASGYDLRYLRMAIGASTNEMPIDHAMAISTFVAVGPPSMQARTALAVALTG